MLKAIIDTHAIIWYVFNDARLSSTAGTFIDDTIRQGDRLGLATISLVEMVYLIEKNKIPATTIDTITQLIHDPSRGIDLILLDEGITQSLATIPRTAVPDMPDRIIAATALRLGIPVISRDGKIQLSQVPTIW
jgi:PIN domain nuclease of toxin-antitoxin system